MILDPITISNSLQHQLGAPQFNSVLTLTTRKQHPIPQIKGSVLQDYPHSTSDTSHNPRLSPVLLTYLLQIGGFHNPHHSGFSYQLQVQVVSCISE